MSVNFEGWVQDMQKFINLSSEKHYKFAFELYDFNKDRYVCTSDAFYAMSLPNSQIFAYDIVKIRQAFVLKVNNELFESRLSQRKKNSKKNASFMSAEEEIKFKVPHVHQSKPEALNLENFLKIRFHYKMPQVIQDIINYLTDLDVSD